MKLADQVLYAIEDATAGRFDSALLHSCTAIDATSRRLSPGENRVGVRYVRCLRQYYWIIEPMIGAGLNLIETKFTNIRLRNSAAPDLAEVIYEILRCSHAHGDEVPPQYSIIPSPDPGYTRWELKKDELHMPGRIIWALLGVAVFSKANASETSVGTHYLSLGANQFPISDWWGREDDFRPFAEKSNQTRVKVEGLERLGTT
ncbi:MAG: hypothetical protein KGL92_03320 [Gammaproteobacteria bacterium]|nr:hypothetical protein [Gammaproteobacteria bacterium]